MNKKRVKGVYIGPVNIHNIKDLELLEIKDIDSYNCKVEVILQNKLQVGSINSYNIKILDLSYFNYFPLEFAPCVYC